MSSSSSTSTKTAKTTTGNASSHNRGMPRMVLALVGIFFLVLVSLGTESIQVQITLAATKSTSSKTVHVVAGEPAAVANITNSLAYPNLRKRAAAPIVTTPNVTVSVNSPPTTAGSKSIPVSTKLETEKEAATPTASFSDTATALGAAISRLSWLSQEAAGESYDHVHAVHGVAELKEHSYWRDWGKTPNRLCQDVVYNETQHERTLVNVTFSCSELFATRGIGTGNWLSAFYALRMVAALATSDERVMDVQMQCTDAVESANSLVTPWLMGRWDSRQVKQVLEQQATESGVALPSLTLACGDYKVSPIGHMLPFVRHELRRMAIALLGVPAGHEAATEFAAHDLVLEQESSPQEPLTAASISHMQVPVTLDSKPLITTNVTLDDAVLHFRCGDLMNSNHPSFGFIKFGTFAKYVPDNVASIGILTQPFSSKKSDVASSDEPAVQMRGEDSGGYKVDKCREVVYAFQDYLQERFPKAHVSIHNDARETIAVAYARMVLAQTAISPISSFSVFPALATFGTGYIRKPDYDKAPNPWLKLMPLDDQVHLMNEPVRLMAAKVKKMRNQHRDDELMEWFRNDEFLFTR